MNVFGEVLNVLGRFVIPVIIFCLLLTIINIVRDYRKYGNKIFAAFKKYEETGNLKDIVINILEQECSLKPIVLSKNNFTFVALTEKEIYGVAIIEFDGKLSGKVMDKYLVMNGKDKRFINPLCKFTEDLKAIKKQGVDIFPLIVKDGRNVELDIEGLPQSRIMTIKDFSYYVYKSQHSDSKYNEEILKKYSKVVGKIINGNN